MCPTFLLPKSLLVITIKNLSLFFACRPMTKKKKSHLKKNKSFELMFVLEKKWNKFFEIFYNDKCQSKFKDEDS